MSPPGSLTPGGEPTILPPPPAGSIGLPNPLAPPGSLPVGGAVPTTAIPPTPPLGLPSPGAGITTLQAYNPEAPAVIIQPVVSVGERISNNINFSANGSAGTVTSLSPGVSVSVDTPRITGVLSAFGSGNVYAPTTSGNSNQISLSLFGSGTGRVYDDRLFIDASSYVTETPSLPGFTLINPSLLPTSQQTLTFSTNISPYLRQSYDGWADAELRYRFGSTSFAGNTTVTATNIPTSGLANGILNEGTLTVVTGPNFQRTVSRLTVDETAFNSNSTSQNTQFSAFQDFEFRFKPNIAGIFRAGFQNIQYPSAPAATFVGATWLAGARLGSAADYGYVSLQYGRVQGVYGFTGSAYYQVTPTITVQAYLTQGLSSPAQYFQSSLSNSTLGPTGAIVNQTSGLPATFVNPSTGLTNGVSRQHIYNFGANDQIGRNTYSIFVYYANSQSLTPPITAPSNSTGVSATWQRDIHPDLNGTASAGYSRTTNLVSVNTPTPLNNTSSVVTSLGLNYLFARQLTGSVIYSFAYQPNGGVLINGHSGSITASSLILYLTKVF